MWHSKPCQHRGKRWDVKAVDERRGKNERSYVSMPDALGRHGCYRHYRTDRDTNVVYIQNVFFNVCSLGLSWQVQYYYPRRQWCRRDGGPADFLGVGSPDGSSHLVRLSVFIIAMLTRWTNHAAATEFLTSLSRHTNTDVDTERIRYRCQCLMRVLVQIGE